ncbi:Putative FAD-dependent glycerol-3-phosphate dehydrogenase [Colletotrichum destructivum]|uniref:glycerol-3-phosphate dehydrogenase n=1 Tax=Colletotrichum destructivum TaxID=34406 RepID=A0AAX4IDY9_9PEZI|nr:Putative FAD-dependent glycerol-3-phosphate dehydrogenase [Colletotrichum destructivum]
MKSASGPNSLSTARGPSPTRSARWMTLTARPSSPQPRESTPSCPANLGLVDPFTSDGRVIFFLPWQGKTIAGTTNEPASIAPNPLPDEKSVGWILNEINLPLAGHQSQTWRRPRRLIRTLPATQGNHLVDVSASGPMTCADGQWTTCPELRRPRLVRRRSLPIHRQALHRARRAPLLRGPDLARGSAQGHGHRDQGAEMTGTGDGKISSGEKMRCHGDAAPSPSSSPWGCPGRCFASPANRSSSAKIDFASQPGAQDVLAPRRRNR